MSVVPRAFVSSSTVLALLASMLLLSVAHGCRGERPVEEKRRPSFAKVDGIDLWINQPPSGRRFVELTTEDPTVQLTALGQRDLRMRGDAAVMEAVVGRAKAVGADAVLMVTTGPAATRKLSRMAMFVRYEGGAPDGAPTTAPVPPAP